MGHALGVSAGVGEVLLGVEELLQAVVRALEEHLQVADALPAIRDMLKKEERDAKKREVG